MARKAAWEDVADADLGPYAKSRGTRWGRVFAGLLFVAGATFVAGYYLPLYRSYGKLAEQYRELGQRSQSLSETVNHLQSEIKTVTATRDELQDEHDQRARAAKSTDEQRERVRAALTSKLDKYLKKHNAALPASAGALSVAFDSALLFSPQKLELTPGGRALLCDVAKISEAKAIAVRASLAADAVVPPALVGSYPSSWALSGARAAAVAQALQACGVAAAKLSATGNGNEPPAPGLEITGDPLVLEISFGGR
jgi:chemotaxis protein MotB